MRQDILVLHQTLFQIGIQLYQKTFFESTRRNVRKISRNMISQKLEFKLIF